MSTRPLDRRAPRTPEVHRGNQLKSRRKHRSTLDAGNADHAGPRAAGGEPRASAAGTRPVANTRSDQGTTKKKASGAASLVTERTSPSVLPDVDAVRTPVATVSCPAGQPPTVEEYHSTQAWSTLPLERSVSSSARSRVAMSPVWLMSMLGASVMQYVPKSGVALMPTTFFERLSVPSAATCP